MEILNFLAFALNCILFALFFGWEGKRHYWYLGLVFSIAVWNLLFMIKHVFGT